ncbi:hypothetical protein DQ04_01181200 [Trypanosoma grayi]|uniref:hypothetical protein n=1 Tax=Trypanosoma grayi TaxID=71804 RepID=UPI0004F4B9CD|nr:hypothetical protein DQ04_01181200 [Trypanosoma grayi]KEG13166.1 hypothetical protein DQ04_01181200 [Trypanosoma grayi]
MAEPIDGRAIQHARDEYMQHFSDVFAEELVKVYESDGSATAVEQLTACIEVGVAVWGHPIAIGNPIK